METRCLENTKQRIWALYRPMKTAKEKKTGNIDIELDTSNGINYVDHPELG